ncbi:MAG: hypothetical protein RIS85_2236 [Pseudomonadota bacterium]|jgi:hypothetical protein
MLVLFGHAIGACRAQATLRLFPFPIPFRRRLLGAVRVAPNDMQQATGMVR